MECCQQCCSGCGQPTPSATRKLMASYYIYFFFQVRFVFLSRGTLHAKLAIRVVAHESDGTDAFLSATPFYVAHSNPSVRVLNQFQVSSSFHVSTPRGQSLNVTLIQSQPHANKISLCENVWHLLTPSGNNRAAPTFKSELEICLCNLYQNASNTKGNKTRRNTGVLQKLQFPQQAKKFPEFYVTRRFTTFFTTSRCPCSAPY